MHWKKFFDSQEISRHCFPAFMNKILLGGESLDFRTTTGNREKLWVAFDRKAF